MAEYYLISREMAEEIAVAIGDKYRQAGVTPSATIDGSEFADMIRNIQASSSDAVKPLTINGVEIDTVSVVTTLPTTRDANTLYIVVST